MEEYDLKDLKIKMDNLEVDEKIKEYISECVKFHTFPAAGLLISTFMVDLALEKLGAVPGERLYAVSETAKCAPDALQVIIHCTYGNHRLRVIDTGRFAITVNRFSEDKTAPGIRVYIDAEKVKKYPTLNLWYRNDPAFKGGVAGSDLLDEILTAGKDILSWYPVNVRFTPKQKWSSTTCPRCGEMVPENTIENGVCRGCGALSYYDKETA
ncbi:formylmethanofuran dehydrogenase [Methanocella sp. CWC-04]|uniref:Formylmethanofuran dehydrogenase n=1 Tax=Methanooceanicella nereidis TaxID=2052831 RepID=A0AAP2RBP7_9EURY|nr:FmdE family protein [Methanocella sp. CWC-04]MCD1294279.1 formylmethanofuran dehydrogenase [Methanocella sp. CWC-04]